MLWVYLFDSNLNKDIKFLLGDRLIIPHVLHIEKKNSRADGNEIHEDDFKFLTNK